MTAYVNRRDIALTEGIEEEFGPSGPVVTKSWWEARLSGFLSTGERVEMERTGDTFAEALKTIEDAIRENGWDIR